MLENQDLVGLIADTHDNKAAVEKAVHLFNDRQIGLVLHAGDYIAPFNAGWMSPLRVQMIGVFGNNDGEKFGLSRNFADQGEIHRAPHAFEVRQRRFLLLHEPDEVDALAASGHYDVIVYGHTHEIDVREGETLVINPGEAGGWTTGRSTVGLLDLARMSVEIVDLEL